MKLKQALQNLGSSRAIAIAESLAEELSMEWADGPMFVFQVIVDDLERVPGNIGSTRDNEESAIRKWLLKYKHGKDGRTSHRISKPSGTVADPIIETIIGARISHLTADDLSKITYAHWLGMSAENILGLLLEEYLADNLRDYGWHCAWGETVRSVDFVHTDGHLLQIKNRSNSENSSSGAIRLGTKIEKWFRIKAHRVEYMWHSLNEICGTTHLSESSFVNFVRSTLRENPDCLSIDNGNTWI